MDCFNESQLHFILYDDFKNNTLSEMQKVYRFLGVDNSFVPEIKPINANKRIMSRTFQKLHYHANHYFFSKFLHDEDLTSLNSFLLKINTKYFEREPLKEGFENRLKKMLKPEIEKLSKILDRDLSHWYSC